MPSDTYEFLSFRKKTRVAESLTIVAILKGAQFSTTEILTYYCDCEHTRGINEREKEREEEDEKKSQVRERERERERETLEYRLSENSWWRSPLIGASTVAREGDAF